MKVSKPRSVDAAIRTLDDGDRRKVFSWFDTLGNWENDEHVRKMAKSAVAKGVYVLDTADDIRIFFSIDVDRREISIVDIAKPSRFEDVPVAAE